MKTNKTRIILISMGLVFAFLIVGAVGVFILPDLANGVAEANPELSQLRLPILILSELVLLTLLAVIVMALYLFGRAYHGQEFTEQTVKTLYLMGWILIAAILPLIAIFVLTEENVSGSITNLYVGLVAAAFFIGGNLFFFIAELLAHANGFKDENDLTV